ncbi:unnamed protein product [Caenorhabditis auriculariae]|uniref:Uncharacterized protein n=1 Tax=Caenorhabditis auriculariae TaxID=2777116 RepID=A0A8S1H579_9PELO|nr:unnamed protein product [Caenorhabditis auriculariae]
MSVMTNEKVKGEPLEDLKMCPAHSLSASGIVHQLSASPLAAAPFSIEVTRAEILATDDLAGRSAAANPACCALSINCY